MGPIDKYGAAMLLSHTVMGLGTVVSLHVALSVGTDISGWLGDSRLFNAVLTPFSRRLTLFNDVKVGWA